MFKSALKRLKRLYYHFCTIYQSLMNLIYIGLNRGSIIKLDSDGQIVKTYKGDNMLEIKAHHKELKRAVNEVESKEVLTDQINYGTI